MGAAELVAIGAAAAAAGGLGTMLGLGGGVFLVPILTLVFDVQLKTAIAASAVAVVANSNAGSGVYLQRRFTNVRLALLMLVSTASGALLGSLLAVSLPDVVLKSSFAALLLYVAFAMSRRRPVQAGSLDPPEADHLRLSGRYYDPASDEIISYTPHRLQLGVPTAMTAGVASGLFGIGGGPIIVPLMNLVMRVPLKAATSTSSFMVGMTASASAIVYYTSGYVDPSITVAAIFGIIGGARLGVWFAARIRPRVLRRVFVGVLALLALSMLLDALGVL